MSAREVRLLKFGENKEAPNNPTLPVILYAGAFAVGPQEIRGAFERHNWRNSWMGGVYGYHHFHTNVHEALGVVRGTATLLIGGDEGQELELRPGDVLVLPAGTGHKRLSASADFEVVGAYPNGMEWNLRTAKSGERERDREEIRLVPLPETDPVRGDAGPLLEHWRTAAYASRDGPPRRDALTTRPLAESSKG